MYAKRGLDRKWETMVLASVGNMLAFPKVSAQMRRLFGPCGSASRHGVLVARDIDTVSEEGDFEAWAAYRKAKRAKKDGKGGGDTGKQEKRKPSEEGRARNGFNRRTGERNRC